MKLLDVKLAKLGAGALSLASFLLGGLLPPMAAQASTPTPLHQLNPYPQGAQPQGQLLEVGGVFYGTTAVGGANNYGELFSFNPSTSSYTDIHDFTATEGAPQPNLSPDGSGNIWGVSADYIFELSGGSFTKPHQFTSSTDGSSPNGGLTLDAGLLWGTNNSGGAHSGGTLYSISPSTGTFTVAVSFSTTSTANGYYPLCQPAIYEPLSGDHILYVTTAAGGTTTTGGATRGTLFKYDIATSTSSVLYTFGTTTTDVYHANSMALDGSGNLYGTAEYGGSFGFGGIWDWPSGTSSMSVGSEILKDFGGYSGDGQTPMGLVLNATSGTLYGVTENGGSASLGTLWSYALGSSSYSILHSFTNTSGTDGSLPTTNVAFDTAGNLWGTTSYGNGNDGTIYEYSSGSFSTVYTLSSGVTNDGTQPNTLILASDGNFYGTTSKGGASNQGTIVQVSAAGTLTTIYSFTGGNDGGIPEGQLTEVVLGGVHYLYGVTEYGGQNQTGTIFRIPLGTTGTLSTRHIFEPLGTGSNTYGAQPLGGLTQVNMTGGAFAGDLVLYGTTSTAGTNPSGFGGSGTVFAFDATWDDANPWTYGSTTVGPNDAMDYSYSFSPERPVSPYPNFDGSSPEGNLVFAADGNLYGIAYYGGDYGQGTLWQVTSAASSPAFNSNEHASYYFGNGTDGKRPQAGLIEVSGVLYGTTNTGGANGDGIIFSFPEATITSASADTVLYSFSSSTGYDPYGGIIYGTNSLGDPAFFGTLYAGGPSSGYGSVYGYDLSTGAVSLAYTFNSGTGSTDGLNPYAGVALDASGSNLIGGTNKGGAYNAGVYFSIAKP